MKHLGSKEKVVEYWNAAAPHMQAKYCHNSLGTKVKVERIDEIGFVNYNLKADLSSLLRVHKFNEESLGDADLIIYMVLDNPSVSYGTIGIAWVGVVCTPRIDDDRKASINEWQPNPVKFAGVSCISRTFEEILFKVQK